MGSLGWKWCTLRLLAPSRLPFILCTSTLQTSFPALTSSVGASTGTGNLSLNSNGRSNTKKTEQLGSSSEGHHHHHQNGGTYQRLTFQDVMDDLRQCHSTPLELEHHQRNRKNDASLEIRRGRRMTDKEKKALGFNAVLRWCAMYQQAPVGDENACASEQKSQRKPKGGGTDAKRKNNNNNKKKMVEKPSIVVDGTSCQEVNDAVLEWISVNTQSFSCGQSLVILTLVSDILYRALSFLHREQKGKHHSEQAIGATESVPPTLFSEEMNDDAYVEDFTRHLHDILIELLCHIQRQEAKMETQALPILASGLYAVFRVREKLSHLMKIPLVDTQGHPIANIPAVGLDRGHSIPVEMEDRTAAGRISIWESMREALTEPLGLLQRAFTAQIRLAAAGSPTVPSSLESLLVGDAPLALKVVLTFFLCVDAASRHAILQTQEGPTMRALSQLLFRGLQPFLHLRESNVRNYAGSPIPSPSPPCEGEKKEGTTAAPTPTTSLQTKDKDAAGDVSAVEGELSSILRCNAEKPHDRCPGAARDTQESNSENGNDATDSSSSSSSSSPSPSLFAARVDVLHTDDYLWECRVILENTATCRPLLRLFLLEYLLIRVRSPSSYTVEEASQLPDVLRLFRDLHSQYRHNVTKELIISASLIDFYHGRRPRHPHPLTTFIRLLPYLYYPKDLMDASQLHSKSPQEQWQAVSSITGIESAEILTSSSSFLPPLVLVQLQMNVLKEYASGVMLDALQQAWERRFLLPNTREGGDTGENHNAQLRDAIQSAVESQRGGGPTPVPSIPLTPPLAQVLHYYFIMAKEAAKGKARADFLTQWAQAEKGGARFPEDRIGMWGAVMLAVYYGHLLSAIDWEAGLVEMDTKAAGFRTSSAVCTSSSGAGHGSTRVGDKVRDDHTSTNSGSGGEETDTLIPYLGDAVTTQMALKVYLYIREHPLEYPCAVVEALNPPSLDASSSQTSPTSSSLAHSFIPIPVISDKVLLNHYLRHLLMIGTEANISHSKLVETLHLVVQTVPMLKEVAHRVRLVERLIRFNSAVTSNKSLHAVLRFLEYLAPLATSLTVVSTVALNALLDTTLQSLNPIRAYPRSHFGSGKEGLLASGQHYTRVVLAATQYLLMVLSSEQSVNRIPSGGKERLGQHVANWLDDYFRTIFNIEYNLDRLTETTAAASAEEGDGTFEVVEEVEETQETTQEHNFNNNNDDNNNTTSHTAVVSEEAVRQDELGEVIATRVADEHTADSSDGVEEQAMLSDDGLMAAEASTSGEEKNEAGMEAPPVVLDRIGDGENPLLSLTEAEALLTAASRLGVHLPSVVYRRFIQERVEEKCEAVLELYAQQQPITSIPLSQNNGVEAETNETVGSTDVNARDLVDRASFHHEWTRWPLPAHFVYYVRGGRPFPLPLTVDYLQHLLTVCDVRIFHLTLSAYIIATTAQQSPVKSAAMGRSRRHVSGGLDTSPSAIIQASSNKAVWEVLPCAVELLQKRLTEESSASVLHPSARSAVVAHVFRVLLHQMDRLASMLPSTDAQASASLPTPSAVKRSLSHVRAGGDDDDGSGAERGDAHDANLQEEDHHAGNDEDGGEADQVNTIVPDPVSFALVESRLVECSEFITGKAHLKKICLEHLEKLHQHFPSVAARLFYRFTTDGTDLEQVGLTPKELMQLSWAYPPSLPLVKAEMEKMDLALQIDFSDYLHQAKQLPMPLTTLILHAHVPSLSFAWCSRLLSSLTVRQAELPPALLGLILSRVEALVPAASDSDRNLLLMVLQGYLTSPTPSLPMMIVKAASRTAADGKCSSNADGILSRGNRKEDPVKEIEETQALQEMEDGEEKRDPTVVDEKTSTPATGEDHDLERGNDNRQADRDTVARLERIYKCYDAVLRVDSVVNVDSLKAFLRVTPPSIHGHILAALMERVQNHVLPELLGGGKSALAGKTEEAEEDSQAIAPINDEAQENQGENTTTIVASTTNTTTNRNKSSAISASPSASINRNSLKMVLQVVRILQKERMLTHAVRRQIADAIFDNALENVYGSPSDERSDGVLVSEPKPHRNNTGLPSVSTDSNASGAGNTSDSNSPLKGTPAAADVGEKSQHTASAAEPVTMKPEDADIPMFVELILLLGCGVGRSNSSTRSSTVSGSSSGFFTVEDVERAFLQLTQRFTSGAHRLLILTTLSELTSGNAPSAGLGRETGGGGGNLSSAGSRDKLTETGLVGSSNSPYVAPMASLDQLIHSLLGQSEELSVARFVKFIQCISKMKRWHLVTSSAREEKLDATAARENSVESSSAFHTRTVTVPPPPSSVLLMAVQDSHSFHDTFQRAFTSADAHTRCVMMRAVSTDPALLHRYETFMVAPMLDAISVLSYEDLELLLTTLLQMQSRDLIEVLLDAIGTRVLSMMRQCKSSTFVRLLQCHAAFQIRDDALLHQVLNELEAISNANAFNSNNTMQQSPQQQRSAGGGVGGSSISTGEIRLSTVQIIHLLQSIVTLDLVAPDRLLLSCFQRVERLVEKLPHHQVVQLARLAVELEMGYTAPIHTLVSALLENRTDYRTSATEMETIEWICDAYDVEAPYHWRHAKLRDRKKKNRQLEAKSFAAYVSRVALRRKTIQEAPHQQHSNPTVPRPTTTRTAHSNSHSGSSNRKMGMTAEKASIQGPCTSSNVVKGNAKAPSKKSGKEKLSKRRRRKEGSATAKK